MRIAVLLLIAFPAAALAQPPAPTAPKIESSPPAERPAWKIVSGMKGKLVRLSADRPVRWVLAEESESESAAEIEAADDGKRCAFVASADGRYKLIAYGMDGGEASRTVIAIGEASPDPSKPDPPKPTPPDPSASLRAKLQAAYAADSSGEKAAQLKLLVELYRQAGPIANDPQVASTLALAKRLATISGSLLQAGQLAGVRKAIAEEIGNSLGQTDIALTPAIRKAAVELFSRIHKTLGEVK